VTHPATRSFPVPPEAGTYEAFLNASLVERFVLMQLDTEVPGVHALAARARSPICARFPQISEGLELIVRDEASHGELGRRSLKRIVPDAEKRAVATQNARLLRGFLLLTSFAAHGAGTLSDLMDQHCRQDSPSS
jgi:hypothetical protein